jgi:hypothetical protein
MACSPRKPRKPVPRTEAQVEELRLQSALDKLQIALNKALDDDLANVCVLGGERE